MVEVVLALGVVAFALLAVVGLLPVGIKANQISAEETRAAAILTALESDLRNTHPLANSGKSRLFGLALPYKWDSTASRVILATTSDLSANTLTASYSTGLTEDQSTVAYTTSNPRPRFQASVIYTQLPTVAASSSPIQARLIVNWPCLNASAVSQLTATASVSGYVEAYVTFPSP